MEWSGISLMYTCNSIIYIYSIWWSPNNKNVFSLLGRSCKAWHQGFCHLCMREWWATLFFLSIIIINKRFNACWQRQAIYYYYKIIKKWIIIKLFYYVYFDPLTAGIRDFNTILKNNYLKFGRSIIRKQSNNNKFSINRVY